MLKRICLLTNYNLYESKRYFTEKLAEAFERKNIQTLLIDVQEKVLGAETISAISRFNPDFTCSFNSLLPVSEKQFLWDFLEIPHLAILVDPALYSINLVNSPYSIISCVDYFDCEVLRSSTQNVFFLPHAVERELNFDPKLQRIYPVTFLGSCYDYETLRENWKISLTKEQCKVLDDAIDMVFSTREVSLYEALVEAWRESQIPANGVDFMTFFYYLDYYTRGKERVDLIGSIKDAEVHVFGDLSQDIAGSILGWPQYLASQKNVVIHPAVNFSESFDIMRRSKICLNSMPFFKNGSHERIFTSLACGSLPLTSENLFVKENFKINSELLSYHPFSLDEVNSKINEVLSNEKKRFEMAFQGRNKVMQFHTWDQRVETIIKTIPAILKTIHLQERE